MVDDELVELAAKLWKQHDAALRFLMKHCPEESVVFANRLLEQQDLICEKLHSATGLTVVKDDSATGYLRFAVAEWDRLPDFKTASGWTKSKRIVLLEVIPPSVSKTGAAHFAIGPGSLEVRRRYFEAFSERAGLKSPRKEISERYTRIGRQRIGREIDDTADDIEENLSMVVSEIVDYAAEAIKKLNAAAESLTSS